MWPLSDLLITLAQVFFVPAAFPVLWDRVTKVSPWMAGSFTIGYALLAIGFLLSHLWFSLGASTIGLIVWSLIWWLRT